VTALPRLVLLFPLCSHFLSTDFVSLIIVLNSYAIKKKDELERVAKANR
jgi:hypothetical protein